MKLRHVVILARHRSQALGENIGRIQSGAVRDIERLRLLPELPLFIRDVTVAVLVPGRAVMAPHGRVHRDTLKIQYLLGADAVVLPIDRQKVLDGRVVL